MIIRARQAQEIGLFVRVTQHCAVYSKATISAVCRHVCTCVSYALQQWVKAHWLFVLLHIHLPARPHTDSHKHIIHLKRFMKWLCDDRTTQTLTLIDSTLWISNLNGLTLTTILWLITNYKFNLKNRQTVFGKLQVTITIFIKNCFQETNLVYLQGDYSLWKQCYFPVSHGSNISCSSSPSVVKVWQMAHLPTSTGTICWCYPTAHTLWFFDF